MHPLFTLASSLPTEGSGIPIHKEGNWPELGEDASENSGDHVIYHPNQENCEKERKTVIPMVGEHTGSVPSHSPFHMAYFSDRWS